MHFAEPLFHFKSLIKNDMVLLLAMIRHWQNNGRKTYQQIPLFKKSIFFLCSSPVSQPSDITQPQRFMQWPLFKSLNYPMKFPWPASLWPVDNKDPVSRLKGGTSYCIFSLLVRIFDCCLQWSYRLPASFEAIFVQMCDAFPDNRSTRTHGCLLSKKKNGE